MKAKCEICGKEIESGLNFFGIFGQKVCSNDCMEKLASNQVSETSKKFHQKKESK